MPLWQERYLHHIQRDMSSQRDIPKQLIRKCLVVIPAWNEAESIQKVVHSVRTECGLDLLVVDDGSEDNTGLLARRAGAMVVFLPMNMGAWTAIQTGFRYALAKGYDACVTMDADGQHFAASIVYLINGLIDGNYDVIIGANPARATRCRQLSWSFFRFLTSIQMRDFTSGLKIYNQKAMHLLLRPRAHLFDYQDLGALLLMRRFGLRVCEIDVAMQKRTHGHSRVFSNWWQVLRYMLLSTILCISKYRHINTRMKNEEVPNDTFL